MNSPYIPEINYSKFEERIHEKVISNRIAIDAKIEVTHRCNLKCAHCYVNLPADAPETIKKELSYQEIRDILDQIVDEGCLFLLFTGGEPFLRSDFLDIYTYTKKKGLITTIYTNGTLLTPHIVDYLQKWPPFSVEITLYGASKETYEKITGVAGSYEQCIKGINLLLEHNIHVELKTMVIILNRHELSKMKEYAKSLGVKFSFDPIIAPRIDGNKTPCKLRLSPEEVVKLDLMNEERFKEWKDFLEKYWGTSKGGLPYTCAAGLCTFLIDPYGKLSLCVLCRSPTYDLRRGNFKDGWCNFLPQVRERELKRDHKCRTCERITLCRCPGIVEMETGNKNGRVEYFCKLAHLRADAFGFGK